MKNNYTIVIVDEYSPYLQDIKKLWRANSRTLGFFPEGAFDYYAKQKQILVAIDVKENCIGYLLYRISHMRVIIVHLCVHSSVRGKGIAKALINHLITSTKEHLGIGLRCRRDYQANKIWPQLGFTALRDQPGRGQSGSNLTFWWYDHGHPSLFTIADDYLFQSKLKAVIDANVFYDLEKSRVSPDNEESKALLADWLKDSVVLCITSEILNEINRHTDINLRNRQRRFAQGFPTLRADTVQIKDIQKKLQSLFPKAERPSIKSDIRQLLRRS